MSLKQTAEMVQPSFPEASAVISESTYVDDIIDSINSTKEAKKITCDMECILKNGNFHMKEWTISSEHNNISIDQSEEKVLGIFWDSSLDWFYFNVKLKNIPTKTENIIW